MFHYLVYDIATGDVAFSGATNALDANSPMTPIVALLAGQDFLIVPDPIEKPHEWRIIDGVPVRKNPPPILVNKTTIEADGADACMISGIPLPGIIRLSGAVYLSDTPLEDDEVRIATSSPGDITVFISAVGHLSWEQTIHAV